MILLALCHLFTCYDIDVMSQEVKLCVYDCQRRRGKKKKKKGRNQTR